MFSNSNLILYIKYKLQDLYPKSQIQTQKPWRDNLAGSSFLVT